MNEEELARWILNVKSTLRRWNSRLTWIAIAAVALFSFLSNSYPNEDRIALSLTIVEILLVLVAFSGFWLFRQEVRTRAEQEARDEVQKVAEPIIARLLPDMIENERRKLEREYGASIRPDDADPDQVAASMGDDDEGEDE